MLRRLAMLALATMWHQFGRDELARFHACWDAAHHWGVLSEARLAALEAGGAAPLAASAKDTRGDRGGAAPA